MGSPTLNSAAPTSVSRHTSSNMFRRTRNRTRSEQPQGDDTPVKPVPVESTRGNNKNRGNGREHQLLFHLKGLFRGHALLKGHGGHKQAKRSAVLVRSTHDLRRSTSTTFTRSTTTHRSSAFLFDHSAMTTTDFLLAEELAAFDDAPPPLQEEEEEEEEEAKEEITASDNVVGHRLPVIDDDLYDDPLMAASFHTAQHADIPASLPLQTAPDSPAHRSPAPESYFAMKKNDHDELGRIQFEFQSLAEAREEAARRQRPILCVEAEVPGDVTTGETIFSHPLIVEAAESLFVTVQQRPLQPQDEEEEEDESQSHHPVAGSYPRGRFFTNSSCRTRVRVLDDMAIDVLPPVEHMTAAVVVAAMVRGLESYRMPVPQYLRLLLEEESGKLQVLSKTRFRDIQGRAVFGMFDPHGAEVEFAGLDGVLATRSGSLVRQPVVQVTYDSRRLSYGALVRHALRRTGANMIYYETNDQRIAAQLEVQQFESFRQTLQQRFVAEQQQQQQEEEEEEESIPLPAIKVMELLGNVRATHTPKPALRGSILRFVPMTDLQATRANRLIHLNKFDEAMHLLSPRQGLIAMESLRAHHHNKSFHFHNVVDVPIGTAWKELCGEDGKVAGADDDSSRCHYQCSSESDDEEDDDTEILTDDEDEPLYQ